jgi:F-type H+-transporting ATPase subunit delta
VDVSETASISSSIAGRYAQALFDLAQEAGKIDTLRADTEALAAALDASADLRKMIGSPVYSRAEQGDAIRALAGAMRLDTLTANTLALMAANRRLFALPHLIRALRAKIAAAKGEMSAEVTSAAALTEAQRAAIASMLKARFGKDVTLNTAVDESLIGGLIVKVGSKMIDTSIRSKLAQLQTAMKEAGT